MNFVSGWIFETSFTACGAKADDLSFVMNYRQNLLRPYGKRGLNH